MPPSETDIPEAFPSELLESLLDPDETAARDALDGDELQSENVAEFNRALHSIEKLIWLRALDSRIISDLFWQELEEKIAHGENVSIGNRVRVNKGTLEISYFRNVYQERGADKKVRFFADHVKRSGKFHYLKKDLKFARPWEAELALGFESHHGMNRKIFKHLSEARRCLRLAEKEARRLWGEAL